MEGTKNPKNKPTGLIRKFISNKLALRGGFGILATATFTILLAAPRTAQAFVHDAIGAWFLSRLLAFVGLVITFLAMIINSILTVISFFLKYVVDWVINLALAMPYTSGSIFISAWPVLRDLANMGLILILVAIGIGTMLNLGSRRGALDKSRLPMFILVAVLINFTPVLTGIIIDFSNIIANVFWQAAKNVPDAFLTHLPHIAQTEDWEVIGTLLEGLLAGTFNSADLFGIIISNASSMVLNLVLIFAFLLLIALFLGRILALMLLVILSPIAFLGLIWGGGKIKNSLWNKWWHNFLQWCIVVIPLLFFMWLSGVFVMASDTVCTQEEFLLPTGGDLADSVEELATSEYVCQGTALLFASGAMMFGVVVSFNSSAAGAKVITSKTKQFGKATARWAEKKAYQTPGYAKGAATALSKEGRAARKERRKSMSAGDRLASGLGAAGRGLYAATGTRKAGRAFQARREEVMQEWKKNKELNSLGNEALLSRHDKEVGANKAFIIDKLSRQAPEKLAEKIAKMSDQERKQYTKVLNQMDKLYKGSTDRLYRDVDPRLKAEQESDPDKRAEILGEQVAKATTSSFRNWTEETLASDDVAEAIVKAGKLNQAANAARDDENKLEALDESIRKMSLKHGLKANASPEEVRDLIDNMSPKADTKDTSRPWLAAAIQSRTKGEKEASEVISRLGIERSDIDRLGSAIEEAMEKAIKDARDDGETNEKTLRNKAYEGAEQALREEHERELGVALEPEDARRLLEYFKELKREAIKEKGKWPGN